MPSVSKSQQALFGMAYSVKTGDKQLSDMPEGIRDEIQNIVDSMTEQQIKDFASTSTEDLPDSVTETLNKMDALGSMNIIWIQENAPEIPKKPRLKLMSQLLAEDMGKAVGYNISQEQLIQAAESAGIDISSFDIEELCIGVGVEMEHGTIDPETNVTNDDLIATLKIAIAHLNENPKYYLELLASGIDENGTGAAPGAATPGSVPGVGGWEPGVQAGKRKLTDREKEFLDKNSKMTGTEGNQEGLKEAKSQDEGKTKQQLQNEIDDLLRLSKANHLNATGYKKLEILKNQLKSFQ